MISITKNIEKNEPKKSSLPKLLFRKDVMEYFGISKSTLHRWVNVEGKLKSFKVGRRRMFKVDDVNGLLENNYS
tara:strand:+ start:1458 stop:1679 length:222 start_codon:yes stop_codon:yes gene_type:complete